MQLSKIKYSSAVFFGVFAVIIYFLLGLLELVLVKAVPEMASLTGSISPIQSLVTAPIVGGLVGYLFVVFAILVYNAIARSYPISWEVKK